MICDETNECEFCDKAIRETDETITMLDGKRAHAACADQFVRAAGGGMSRPTVIVGGLARDPGGSVH